MRKFRSLLSMSLVGALLLTAVPAQAQINDLAHAIDEAGQQSMLGQRILKDYSLIILDVKASTHQKDLTDTIKRYDTLLSDLQNFPGSALIPGVPELLDKVASAWEPVKRLASSSPKKDQLHDLHELTEALLEANEELTHTLAISSSAEANHLIEVSERQDMLTQRIAALYMLHALGVDEETYLENMQNATFEFMLGLEELQSAEQNTRSIKSGLKKVKTQFKMLEFSVNKGGTTYFPAVVSEAAEKILHSMEAIVAEYVELGQES